MANAILTGFAPAFNDGLGQGDVFTSRGNDCGPFVLGGYVYVLGYTPGAGTLAMQMKRSTDPLINGWANSGSTLSLPAGTNGFEKASAYVVGTVIHWAIKGWVTSTGATGIYYASFDTSTQTWSALGTAVASSTLNQQHRANIAVMTNGDIVIGYSASTSKSTAKTYYAKRVGTTWTAANVVDDNASTAVQYSFVRMFRDPITNILHFFYVDKATNVQVLKRRTVTSAYVLSASVSLLTRSSSAGSSWSFSHNQMGMYSDGTTTYFYGVNYDNGWNPEELDYFRIDTAGSASVLQNLPIYQIRGTWVQRPITNDLYYLSENQATVGSVHEMLVRFVGSTGYPAVTGQSASSLGGTNANNTEQSTWSIYTVPGSGNVVIGGWVVDDAGGTDQSANYYESILAYGPPTVSNVNPYQVDVGGGATVIITGTNFTGVTGVTVGGTAVTSYTVNSLTQITATVPAKAVGTYDVTVTTAAGSNANTAGDNLTYAVLQNLTRNVTDSAPAQDAVGVTAGKFLLPDTVLQQTNTTGTVSLINTSPASTTDTDWMAGPGQGVGGAQSVRLGFETPPSPLTPGGSGAHKQTFRFRVKRSYP